MMYMKSINIDGMVKHIEEIFHTFRNEDYMLPVLITILIIFIKFFVNRKTCALDYKEALIELPFEIITLALVFLITMNIISAKALLIKFVGILLLLFVSAAITAALQDKLGDLRARHIF